MGTVVGIECSDGGVVAGDRRIVDGEVVRSESARKVFDLEGAVLGFEDGYGSIQDATDRVESEMRRYAVEHGKEMGIGRLSSLVSEVAKEKSVNAVVCGRGDSGEVDLRGVDSKGGVIDDRLVAWGSGSAVVIGVLENTVGNRELGIDEGVEVVRQALEVASGRDTKTGDEIDVCIMDNHNVNQ